MQIDGHHTATYVAARLAGMTAAQAHRHDVVHRLLPRYGICAA